MKLTRALILTAALVLTSQLQASNLPAPLPEFMDHAQTTKWTTEQAAQTASSEAPATFYTGKPYVADAGGYIYKYRTLNPEMGRWTSADPSGYPDGVNNHIYASVPTNELDPLGLKSVIVGYTVTEILSSTLNAAAAVGAGAGAVGAVVSTGVKAAAGAVGAAVAAILVVENAVNNTNYSVSTSYTYGEVPDDAHFVMDYTMTGPQTSYSYEYPSATSLTLTKTTITDYTCVWVE